MNLVKEQSKNGPFANSRSKMSFARPLSADTVVKLFEFNHCGSQTPVPWELAANSDISIRAEAAWEITRGSPDITVAIIDEEFDVQRLPSDAKVRMVNASNCATPSSESWKDHGTRLAQLIAGSKDGYPGVCPKCSLLLIKLPTHCTDAEEARAFDLALQFNSAAVCCAWGPPYLGPNVYRPVPEIVSQSIEELATKSRGGRGCLIFFAAGNSGADLRLDGYASHPMVQTVSGITKLGHTPPNLDFGDKIKLLAPVSSVDGKIGGPLEIPEGASGATALMAAVSGLVLSVNRNLSSRQVFSLLEKSHGTQDTKYCSNGATKPFGPVAAYEAVLNSITTVPMKSCCIHSFVFEKPYKASASGKKQFRERRFNGGEHSFFGLTAAATLQTFHQFPNNPGDQTGTPNTDPANSFGGGLFSNFVPSGQTLSYSASVAAAINAFFTADLTSSSAALPKGTISSYPSLITPPTTTLTGVTIPIPFHGIVPFGYLVGLAADVYPTPDVLVGALGAPTALVDMLSGDENQSTGNNLEKYVGFFQAEIIENVIKNGTYSDDVLISLYNLPDCTYYLTLAELNYSHFIGHNLFFYLSYHLLAVFAATQLSTADASTFNQKFQTALVTEAFALHFLTDMFSSGHGRVPRWAFLNANPPLTYTVTVQPSGGSASSGTGNGGSGAGTSGSGTGGGTGGSGASGGTGGSGTSGGAGTGGDGTSGGGTTGSSTGSNTAQVSLTQGGADLISKLIHDYEGQLGVAVMNSPVMGSSSTTTPGYIWKNYGDGSLHLGQLSATDNLIYASGSNLQAATLKGEPIQWSQYMPQSLAPTDTLRRFDLIIGLVAASMADVFMHMANNANVITSATGQGNNGLLGYVLERIPLALPIKSGLSAISLSPDNIMKTLFSTQSPSVSGSGSSSGSATTGSGTSGSGTSSGTGGSGTSGGSGGSGTSTGTGTTGGGTSGSGLSGGSGGTGNSGTSDSTGSGASGGSGTNTSSDYTQTELGARLMAGDNYQPLWDVYQSLSKFIKGKDKFFYYGSQVDFANDYCTGKFDAASSAASTPFEEAWVTAQIGNLQEAFTGSTASGSSTSSGGTTDTSGLTSLIPSIITGSPSFSVTVPQNVVSTFSIPTDPATNLPLKMPNEWAPAVPPNLVKALTANPNGVWGIEQ